MSDGFIGDGFVGGSAANSSPPATAGLITKQTTAGLSTANSYINLDDLYDYADDVGYLISASLSARQMETAMIRAMAIVEGYEHKFFGYRPYELQSTAFPRTGSYAGYTRTNYIPPLLLSVQAAYTIVELVELLDTTPAEDAGAVVKKTRKKIGELEVETEYVAGTEIVENTRTRAITDAENLLNQLIRLGRSRYGRVLRG